MRTIPNFPRHVLVRSGPAAAAERALALGSALERRGHTVTLRPEADGPVPADVVVSDHGEAPLAEEQALRARGAVLACLDGRADRAHACDLLVDATPGRGRADFAGLIPRGARGLFGPRYALPPQDREGGDGLGAERIAAALGDLVAAPPFVPGAVALRPARAADAHRLWIWRNDPVSRAMARSSAPVGWDGHRAWLAARLAERERTRLLVAEADGEPIGSLRLDRIRDGQEAEVTLIVSPLARGLGLGGRLLDALAADAAETGFARRLIATIRADNAAGRRLLERAGFRLAQAGTAWPRYERTVIVPSRSAP